jgi:hypothetical protein
MSFDGTNAYLLETGLGAHVGEDAHVRVLESYGVVAPTTYSDNFNRADGALTTPWVTIEGTHSIASNLVPVGTGSPNTSKYSATFTNDQWAEADIASLGSTSTIMPCVRVNTSGDLYYAWTDGSHLIIVKRVGGTYTTVATGPTFTFAGPNKIAIEVVGSTIKAYLNGTVAITTSDTQVTTGLPGFISANGAGATLDNWRGGNGAYPGPPATTYVKYRTFNGTSDQVTFSAGNSNGKSIWNPGTAVICLARTRSDGSGAGSGYQEWFSNVFSNGQLTCATYFNPNNNLDVYDGATGNDVGPPVVVADGWVICAVSRGTFSGVNPRAHIYKFSTTAWTHTAFNQSQPGGSMDSASYFELGNQNGWGQFLAANVAALAYYDYELTDTQIQTLATSLATWTSLGPAHLWRMDSSTLADSAGTSIATITGTTLTTSDSPLAVS